MEAAGHGKRTVVHMPIEGEEVLTHGFVDDGGDVAGMDQRRCPADDLHSGERLLGQRGASCPLGGEQAVTEQDDNGDGDEQDAGPRRAKRRAQRSGHGWPPLSRQGSVNHGRSGDPGFGLHTRNRAHLLARCTGPWPRCLAAGLGPSSNQVRENGVTVTPWTRRGTVGSYCDGRRDGEADGPR